MSRDQALEAGIRQLVDWARAWVENETCILETPSSNLEDAEKAALVLMALVEKQRVGGL